MVDKIRLTIKQLLLCKYLFLISIDEAVSVKRERERALYDIQNWTIIFTHSFLNIIKVLFSIKRVHRMKVNIETLFLDSY